MLHKRDVIVGQCYVNNERKVARKVLVVDQKTVKFNTYHLNSGNSCGSPSECTLQDFKHWANREASPTEISSLQHREMEALEHDISN